jgi:hypothetical protein
MTSSPRSVKFPYQVSSNGARALCGVSSGSIVTHPIYAIEHHTPPNCIIVELGQLVPVKQNAIFTITHNLHVRFKDLCRKVIAEYKIDVMVEPIPLTEFNVFEMLFKLAKHNHQGDSRIPWFFHKQL